MSTPLSTPIRQAKLGISSTKSLPLANEYKKLLAEQYQRLWLKHQQDLDLIDDIRSYVKSRLSIEREYTQALSKLSKSHIAHINKRFTLLQQCDNNNNNISSSQQQQDPASSSHVAGGARGGAAGAGAGAAADLQRTASQRAAQVMLSESEASDSRLQKRLANNGLDEPDKACTLYKVWSEHINRLQSSTKNRADQFELLTMVLDKLKDLRSHKANIGKKCLDSHLKRIQEDILVSMVDVEKARKLYYEDESQAKKARENEEKIKKKRSGLLTKFTGVDLQAKKEKTSAQREANDIQSTQARNDYIMALAAANAHLQHYYVKDLADFMNLIDDGVLDHCKIFMATLSECDINSLKETLHHAQYWSKMINLTGSQKTNSIFLDCDQSQCLKNPASLVFEPCNSDPIASISLEHNADYALQHEIDKWFTWFKKECRNLSQLIHQLERCQRALAEGQKSIELNGQTVDDLEPKIIELKQQIRKSEAAKLKAQARLKVIKEGGMQIEEWSAVESEIRADMARAQEELESKRLREVMARRSSSADENDEMMVDDKMINDHHHHQSGLNSSGSGGAGAGQNNNININSNSCNNNMAAAAGQQQVLLQISKDSDGGTSELVDGSMHNLASVSRSTSNLMDKQQKAISGYSALTDPSLVWQDDYSSAWNATAGGQSTTVDTMKSPTVAPTATTNGAASAAAAAKSYNHLETSQPTSSNNRIGQQHQHSAANNTVQSSSPLSAIMDGNHGLSTSPYQTIGEAYKSDYECDYNRTSGPNMMASSAASSAEPRGSQQHYGGGGDGGGQDEEEEEAGGRGDPQEEHEMEDVSSMIGRLVIAQYTFDKTNEDDLSFVEGDILRVLEVSDSNWLQARHEATGEQGFIPAPYVRLLHPDGEQQQQPPAQETSPLHQDQPQQQQQQLENSLGDNFKYESYVEDSNELFDEDEDEDQFGARPVTDDLDERPVYCRALYDYQPEADTYEPDGLPHVALSQGEVLRVLDQGEEDGWWLVERNDGTTKGHVPSMLVEELEEGEEGGACNQDDGDDDTASERSDYPDLGAPPPPLPDIEPPKLPDNDDHHHHHHHHGDVAGSREDPPRLEEQSATNAIPAPPTQADSARPATSSSSSLVATSFIIIEPTPEVESRSVTGSGKPEERTDDAGGEQTESPPAKGYSVINEDFVLEGPTRKPSQLNETNNNNNNNNNKHEFDDSDIPAPPSVVIESFEVEKHDDSSGAGSPTGEDEPTSAGDDQDETSQAPPREIKHTGNVDVNPILRHRAEEFTKQIIAEAIAMTPQITANNQSRTSEDYNDDDFEQYRYRDTYNGRDDLEDEEEEGGNQ